MKTTGRTPTLPYSKDARIKSMLDSGATLPYSKDARIKSMLDSGATLPYSKDARIKSMLDSGATYRETARVLQCSTRTVAKGAKRPPRV